MAKKLLWLAPIIIIGFFFFTGQDFKGNDDRKWSIDQRMTKLITTNEYAPLPVVEDRNFVHSTQMRVFMTPAGVMSVTPNIRPYPTTNTNQSEVIITRHPINQNIMLASGNMSTIGGTLFISEGVYVTTNGGVTWFGSDTLNGAPIGNHGGDPGPAIDHNGRMYMSHLGFSTSGMFANYSTNNGLNWSNTFTIASGSQDKNFTAVDDDPSSPFYGRAYTVWSLFTAANPPIAVSYTSNGGVNWTAAQQVNVPPSGHYSQGVDIRTGPGGAVNLIWTAPISSSPFTGDFCGFARSTNGGVNWTVNENVFDINGIRNSSFGTYGIRTNDFPRIDIDRSGGARNGWIYVVVPEKSPGAASDAADIILRRSSNNGTTWSAPIRVNQDTPGNGKLQFFPAVRVDEFGGVNVIWYDNRNTASDSAEVYMGRSLDGGTTWSEIIVSDHRFRPRAITGLAGGYSGDYIGITSGNAKIWPVWMDNSTGNYQLWTAGINIANYPLNSFNLQTPSAGVTINSLPNSSTPVTFTWDTSATGASYKWIFGTTLPTRQITQQTSTNSMTMTLGQLDVILAGLGLSPGQQLVGQWDAWAFRPNPPANDSLKAANGPRAVTLRRGIPSLTAFNLTSPANNTTIVTSIFNSSNVGFNWTKSGDGTTYKFKFGSPTLGNQQMNFASGNGGYDTSFVRTSAQLDAILAGLGVAPGGSLVGQWAVYAYNGQDSLKSVQTHNLTFQRSGVTALFYDDFSTGTNQWAITNNGGNCVWQTFSQPYPNNYTLPAAALQPVLSADADNCGSGTTTLSTITVLNNINCTGYQNITLEWDNDWNAIDNQDTARVQASYDGGSTWVTVSEFYGTDVRNSHEVRSLTPATNISNLKIRFISIQPGFDWWWTVDNITVKGDLMVGVTNNNSSIPDRFALYQNYPNPFNPATRIKFDIPQQSLVTIKLYDVAGREVTRLVNNSTYSPGSYSVEFNAANLASGVYFYRIEAGDFVEIKKMMLVK
jgi:hypothetical protein